MKQPDITHVSAVLKFAPDNMTKLPDGRYVPARPLGGGWRWNRIKATWLVFSGKADALLWDGQ